MRAARPNPARERLRSRLYRAQGGRCGICGRRMGSLLSVTLDHVWPRAAGGTDRNNLVAAHSGCNHAKADRLPTGCEVLWLIVALTGADLAKAGRRVGRWTRRRRRRR